MDTENMYDKLRKESWDKALKSFGYSYIFSEKAKFYSRNMTYITTLGILVPFSVGAIAVGYGITSVLKYALLLAAPLGVLQLLLSVLAVTFKWEGKLSYAYEATKDHAILSEEFRKIADRPPSDYSEFTRQFDLIETKLIARLNQDANYTIKEKENRKGMRYGLRQFQRECVGCKKTPLSMESTDCNVCGKF